MATMTVSLPDPMKEWIEAETRKGDYASTSDFMRDLVRREKARREEELTLEDVRRIVAEARAGGISNRTIADIIAEGDAIARSRGVSLD